MERFDRALALFHCEYGDQYDVDYLLLMAQGYQESELRQEARSPRRGDRSHAGHARDRQGHAHRRHHADRAQYPRRGQVRARDD